MTSVQENKNELEAAVRYCESAISRAQATIESMEFRQEMAKKQHSEQTGREEALQREVAELKAKLAESKPTMPVIPKDVAIAIFREGVWYGAKNVCDELNDASDICIEENEYCGAFDVTFAKEIDLSDYIDTNWLQDKVVDQNGYSSEENVKDALKHLCENSNFECRIHGVDDPQEKKND